MKHTQQIHRINLLLQQLLLDDALTSGMFWIEYTQTLFTTQQFRVFYCGQYLGAVSISPTIPTKVTTDEISRWKLACWLHANGFKLDNAQVLEYSAKTIFESQGHVRFDFDRSIEHASV